MGAFYVDQKKKDLLPSTLPSEHEQWGLSTNDPGIGGAVFHYPVTFNPFIALAGTIRLGAGGSTSANDAVVTELGTTSCRIDSTPVEYTSPYRVVVIGRN